MSAVLPVDFTSAQIGSLAGQHQPFHLPSSVPEATLHLVVPEFDFRFLIPLEELSKHIAPNKVNVRFAVDAGLTLTLALTGKPVEGGAMFEPEEGTLNFELANEKAPRAQFVGVTLMAMLGLAKEVTLSVPEIELNLGMRFNIPLREISAMLLSRQLNHALMVIQRATGRQFEVLPTSLFDKEERDSMAFIYHAIVDRSFIWPLIHPIGATIIISEDVLTRFPADGKTFKYLGPLGTMSKSILGESISIGDGQIHIADAVFHDPVAAKREITNSQSGMATVGVESLSGQAKFDFPNAPRLPDAPWDLKLQSLIDLEPKLDACLAEAYHALATATLAELSEDEKALVTSRPELDEDARLMND
jgi:hypothetical protein